MNSSQNANHNATSQPSGEVIPLQAGLEALSEELPRGRLKRSLKQLGRRLEAGESWETVLQDPQLGLPENMRTLMRIGLQTNNLPLFLDQYLAHKQAVLEGRRRIWLGLGYSLILLAVVLTLTAFLLLWVVPQFRTLYEDFNIALPTATAATLNISFFLVHYGFWVLIGLAVLAALVWWIPRLLGGKALQRRLLLRLPLLGPVLKYSAVSQFCHLLGLLVESGIPLPQAVRLAAEGSDDADLQQAADAVAEKVSRGARLDEAASHYPQFPHILLPALRWESGEQALADALHASGAISAERSRVAGGLIAAICEPLTILVLGIVTGFIVIVLLAPNVKLLNALS